MLNWRKLTRTKEQRKRPRRQCIVTPSRAFLPQLNRPVSLVIIIWFVLKCSKLRESCSILLSLHRKETAENTKRIESWKCGSSGWVFSKEATQNDVLTRQFWSFVTWFRLIWNIIITHSHRFNRPREDTEGGAGEGERQWGIQIRGLRGSPGLLQPESVSHTYSDVQEQPRTNVYVSFSKSVRLYFPTRCVTTEEDRPAKVTKKFYELFSWTVRLENPRTSPCSFLCLNRPWTWISCDYHVPKEGHKTMGFAVQFSDIKLKKWDEAEADCNAVLKVEPDNMKGTSVIFSERRATVPYQCPSRGVRMWMQKEIWTEKKMSEHCECLFQPCCAAGSCVRVSKNGKAPKKTWNVCCRENQETSEPRWAKASFGFSISPSPTVLHLT